MRKRTVDNSPLGGNGDQCRTLPIKIPVVVVSM